MTVAELISDLQKNEDPESEVYFEDPSSGACYEVNDYFTKLVNFRKREVILVS